MFSKKHEAITQIQIDKVWIENRNLQIFNFKELHMIIEFEQKVLQKLMNREETKA